LFVTLTKDSAKNNFLEVANTIRDKIGDLLNKRIDVKTLLNARPAKKGG